MHATGPTPSYLITLVVVAGVWGLRLWRMRGAARKDRRLRLEFMWITPALMVLGAVVLLSSTPPRGLEWLWMVVILAAGAGLGWVRGGLIPITVDPQTHLLNTRTSPAAMAFLVVLLGVRYGARALLAEQQASLHIATALITDGFVLFAAGLFGVSRLEMWLRARRLLAAARRQGAAQDAAPDRLVGSPWGTTPP